MKSMKKTIFACLMAAMLVTAVGCGSSNDASSAPESSQPETSQSQPESVPESSESEAPEEELTVDGVVAEITEEGKLVIKLEDETTLTFELPEDADMTKAENLAAGATVTITYTGAIDGEDTANAVVTAVEIITDSDAPAAESETPASDSSSAA